MPHSSPKDGLNGPPAQFRVTKAEVVPPFAVFEGWGTTDDGIRGLWKVTPASRGLGAMATKEREVEAGGAHLSKITKGGAASVIFGVGNDQSWASPHDL
jgi:hypothetical protein